MKLEIKSGRENKIHIHIDGEYKLTVDSEFWFTSPWHGLKEIDEDEYEEMSSEIEKRRAFNNAVSLAMSRLHSKGELVTKLSKKYSREASEYAADKCEEIGVINDADFATLYANELHNRKGMGISRIKQELKRKGIDGEIIQDTIDNLEIDVDEKLKELIERKYYRQLGDEKGRRRTVNALLRLGYGFYDIRRAMEEYGFDEEEG